MDYNLPELTLPQLIELRQTIDDNLKSRYDFFEVIKYGTESFKKFPDDKYVPFTEIYHDIVEFYNASKIALDERKSILEEFPILRVYENNVFTDDDLRKYLD